METIAMPPAHIGRKISRIRELRGMKQETLAQEIGVSQQTVSKIEQSETVEDATLGKIAKAFGMQPEAIKNFNEESVLNYVNNFHDNSTNQGQQIGPFHGCTFNPLDKVVELYERLLQSEREKVELLKGSARG